MKYLRIVGPVLAVLALMAAPGLSTAGASGLWKYTTPAANDTLGLGTELVATLEPGTSFLVKDTIGGAHDTCTSMEFKFKIERDTSTGLNPQGKVTSWTLGGCSHTTTTLANGELEIKHIAGSTNGTLVSKGTRITTKSTIFGISCVANTGAGTTLGTITGAKLSTAKATIDFNAVVTKENGCGDSTETGTLYITSPLGLMVESEF